MLHWQNSCHPNISEFLSLAYNFHPCKGQHLQFYFIMLPSAVAAMLYNFIRMSCIRPALCCLNTFKVAPLIVHGDILDLITQNIFGPDRDVAYPDHLTFSIGPSPSYTVFSGAI